MAATFHIAYYSNTTGSWWAEISTIQQNMWIWIPLSIPSCLPSRRRLLFISAILWPLLALLSLHSFLALLALLSLATLLPFGNAVPSEKGEAIIRKMRHHIAPVDIDIIDVHCVCFDDSAVEFFFFFFFDRDWYWCMGIFITVVVVVVAVVAIVALILKVIILRVMG